MATSRNLSIIIPAYNEELSIARVVTELRTELPKAEIVVVNDGSADKTGAIAAGQDCILINHTRNRGYGASWKTGLRNATRDFVLFYDGDGQFEYEDVKRMIDHHEATQADLVSGSRQTGSHQPIARKPGKLVLLHFANFIARQKIPDANCGLRLFRRRHIVRYMDLLPDGFSASMTSLLLFFKRGYHVEFLPIVVQKREGTSSVRQIRDGFGTILLMTRLAALFDPLRIFLPAAGVLVSLSFIYSIYEALMFGLGIPVLGATGFIGGLLLFFMGIICDQISALRLERFAPVNEQALESESGETSTVNLQNGDYDDQVSTL